LYKATPEASGADSFAAAQASIGKSTGMVLEVGDIVATFAQLKANGNAMTNTFGGPLVPGRRSAAPLPTTEVRDWFVVGRGAAGLRPGNPPNQPSPQMLRCAQHDMSRPLSHGMP